MIGTFHSRSFSSYSDEFNQGISSDSDGEAALENQVQLFVNAATTCREYILKFRAGS